MATRLLSPHLRQFELPKSGQYFRGMALLARGNANVFAYYASAVSMRTFSCAKTQKVCSAPAVPLHSETLARPNLITPHISFSHRQYHSHKRFRPNSSRSLQNQTSPNPLLQVYHNILPGSGTFYNTAQNPSRDLFGNLSFIRNAGHSKWANIRHIKAAKDGEKMQASQKYVARIKVAIREGNGPDPKFNYQLARVLEQAHRADIPKSTIDNVMKNIMKSKDQGSIAIYEARGPGNFAMVIEAFTDSVKRTVVDINHCYKKFGGRPAEKIAAAFFDRKGVIIVPPRGSLTSYDEIEEAAILAEAEEVHEELDEEGGTIYKVICDEKTVYGVRKQLAADHPDVPLDNATFHYIPKPHSMAPLSGANLETAVKIVTALENVPDVQRVYTNIEVLEEES